MKLRGKSVKEVPVIFDIFPSQRNRFSQNVNPRFGKKDTSSRCEEALRMLLL
jgi:hypothetical protein